MLQPRLILGLALAGLIAGAAVSGQQPAPSKAPAAKAAAAPAGPVLVFNFAKGIGSSKQALGSVEIETFPAEAPKSIEHVIRLVRSRFYNGLRVHWSTPSLIQFGDPMSRDMTKRDLWGTGGSGRPVGVAEANLAKHKFERGVVGLAYRQNYDPKTADSQIFVIKGANSAANGRYAVLGRVIDPKMMTIIDKLEVGDRIDTATVR